MLCILSHLVDVVPVLKVPTSNVLGVVHSSGTPTFGPYSVKRKNANVLAYVECVVYSPQIHLVRIVFPANSFYLVLSNVHTQGVFKSPL